MNTWMEGGVRRVGFAIEVPAEYGLRWPVVFVKVGETGYWEASDPDQIPEYVAESALAASMFGWNTPAAQPALDYVQSHLPHG